MVHIKKLEVYGFKSFGFKNTIVNFEKGLVAVTGPNGSGKSNILDAIMFAIGENSPKALRVDKFQSLFHDSQNSSHRLIRVSLVFDNQDRGIPVDSDSVTLTREMEGQTGESKYYLNGKSVSKTSILELLEIVLAAPNKLNIVQQGMITRISELNSEERRKVIEDIVGLSFFDEKKAEALKQLDESDRRLEVAMAKMGEIRKRIDELESERNDQIRYEQLVSEIKRLKAIKISGTLKSIDRRIETSSQVLDSNAQRLLHLSKQVEEANIKITTLDSEKTRFMEQADAANRAKATVASRISTVFHDLTRTKAILAQSEERIVQIQRRIPAIDSEIDELGQRVQPLQTQILERKSSLDKLSSDVGAIKQELDEINKKIASVSLELQKWQRKKRKLEERHKRLLSIKSEVELLAVKASEKINTNDFKAAINRDSISQLQSEIQKRKVLLSELEKSLEHSRIQYESAKSLAECLAKNKDELQKELGDSGVLLAKAEGMAAQFEAKSGLAKSSMTEDIAIAELMKNPDGLDIRGLVHNLIRWDRNYERPILAAGSEWMKAFVVEDVKSMISLAAVAKEKKLPRLKVIPLSAVSRSKRANAPKDDVSIVGNLADFVYSEYDKLADFLFGDTFLVRSPASAYSLARQGWRAVTVDGELFEPSGSLLSIDFGSKITDLTRVVLLGSSVEKLRQSITTMKKLIERKNIELSEMTSRLDSVSEDKMRLELLIGDLTTKIDTESDNLVQKERMLQEALMSFQGVESERNTLGIELEKYHRRLSLLGPSIENIANRLERIAASSALESELSELEAKRAECSKSIAAAGMEQSEIAVSIASVEAQIKSNLQRTREITEEKQRLEVELSQKSTHVQNLRLDVEKSESDLVKLRNQEQEIIDSSGTSYAVLQEYERKLKMLTEDERRLSREVNVIERESALLRKDLAGLQVQRLSLGNELAALGYKDRNFEEQNVDELMKELSSEYELVKSKINLRADESYVQVIDGYRGMSARRNQLEQERKSIVSFIEGIVQEKTKVFMDAFNKVDGDIRRTFSEITTGGSAWLEIEDPEDIFSSGVMLVVQFPGKPGRESTALSGGEKTIAATVFLLALQSLKPSPFYLMDEVDAHLDAQNTERLSKILLERSKDNQIIMVTLKDSTVAKAAIVYGVYPKEGVSQVVRYRNTPAVTVQSQAGR